jgi:hypothetical protein
MGKLKENIISECIEIIKRDDVKKEIKEMFSPIIDLILHEIYPYIFLSMIFVIISFLLILGIFILLLRNKKPVIKTAYF